MSKQEEEMNKRFDNIAVYTNEYGYVHPIPKAEEIKSFLQSEIDLAVVEERKRIVEMIETVEWFAEDAFEVKKKILSLITKEN